ncbi:LysR family transcriptional regulator [Paenibacillus sepulcri]|uniref:LysR family transcriptional regulator n=1 Tax=Paenibacillus sepulcri TaxID=359917 RepID=A0ABS7C6Z4_9BACL|nr:LysR family transcriptional regulator [Paenibacillus sepulcri]
MDMEGLHSFIVVAREKSISKAAQLLHVTQPTLSARLRKLEDGLGVTLLERNWDGIRLTKEGRFFLAYSVQLFQELEEASALLRKQENRELEGPFEAVTDARRLRIGVESFFHPAFMSPIIEGIQQIAPEIECKFIHKHSEVLQHLLDCGSLDICIHTPTDSFARQDSLFVMRDKVVVLTPKENYPVIAPDLSNLPLLRSMPFVLFENSPLLSYHEMTERMLISMFGGVPERFHIVNDVGAALDIVISGFGHTFLPATSIAHLIGKPLPFNMVLVEYDFVNLPVLVTYSASPTSAHPTEQIARRIHSSLVERVSCLFPNAYQIKG